MHGQIARWTTPSIFYKPKAAAVGEIAEVEITLKQLGRTIIRKGKEQAAIVEDGFIWHFEQTETSGLTRNTPMTVQVDYLTTNGQRYTTREYEYLVCDSAVNEVIM